MPDRPKHRPLRMPLNLLPVAKTFLQLRQSPHRIELMQRINIQKQRGITHRHHFVDMPELLLGHRQLFTWHPGIHDRQRITRLSLLIFTQVFGLSRHFFRREQSGFASAVSQPLPRFVFLADAFDTLCRMQQATADLLGGKRRQARPLKT